MLEQVHVFQLYPFLEQSHKAFKACRTFVFSTLPEIQRREAARKAAGDDDGSPSGRRVSSSSDGRLDDQVEEELDKEIIGNVDAKIVDGAGEVERSVTREDAESVRFEEESEGDSSAAESSSVEKESVVFGSIRGREDTPVVDSPGELEVTTDPIAEEVVPAPILQRSAKNSISSPHLGSRVASINTRPSSLYSSPSSRSQPQSPTRTRAKIPGGGRYSTVSGTHLSALTSLVRSSTIMPVRPETRARANSHPDIVQLLAQYAEGPANRTTTYHHPPP